jgi:hypothetical protein
MWCTTPRQRVSIQFDVGWCSSDAEALLMYALIVVRMFFRNKKNVRRIYAENTVPLLLLLLFRELHSTTPCEERYGEETLFYLAGVIIL